MEEVLIIGSGPAGLTAAIYSARASLNPLLIAGTIWGGQLMNTTEVENYPGFINGILGPELMENMKSQAERFGTKFVFENAISLERSEKGFIVSTYDKKYEAKSLIIATGATPRKLGISGEDKFYGRGVSTCATCDGAFFREKVICVIGGGDSAMEEATFLTRFAKKVYLIHRRDKFRASEIMQKRVRENEKIEVILNTTVEEVIGEDKVEKIRIKKEGVEKFLELDGVFIAIGHIPVTEFLKGFLELNDEGYIVSHDGVSTSEKGVFVAGDVTDFTYRQAITAAGAGCKAALTAERYLREK